MEMRREDKVTPGTLDNKVENEFWESKRQVKAGEGKQK